MSHRFSFLIDAQSPDCTRKLFSLTLLERVLRQIHELGHRRCLIVGNRGRCESLFSGTFARRYRIELCWIEPDAMLQPEAWIVLQGNAVYDDSILTTLQSTHDNLSIHGGEDAPAAYVVHTHVPLKVCSLFLIDTDRKITISEMAYYNSDLRLWINPLFQIVTEQTRLVELENKMYAMTFKGSMDFIATYLYRTPVRAMVRFLAPTEVSPNFITFLSIMCSVTAVPAFAFGWLGTGVSLGFLFIVLDSLDGKLARLTVRLSPAAGHWDRKTSTPAVALWSVAWGWWISGGSVINTDFYNGVAIFCLTLLDKFTRIGFRSLTGRSVLDFTERDRRFHLFASKRTTNLFLLTIGVCLEPFFAGAIRTAFYAITVWLSFTWLWHLMLTLSQLIRRHKTRYI